MIWAAPEVNGRPVPAVVVVVDGEVSEVWPPFTDRHWTGKDARQVWRELAAQGAQPRWAPHVTPIRPYQRDDWRRIRRWERVGEIAAKSDTLTLAVTDAGEWFLIETSQSGVGWQFPDFATALTECAHRLMDGVWVRVPANYGPHGQLLDQPLHVDLD